MDKLRLNRPLALTAGLALVLIPTLFSVFVEWTEWEMWIRVVVVLVWLVSAAVVVASTVRQGEQVEDLIGTTVARRTTERSVAAGRLIRALLSPQGTGLTNHEFRLFLPDADRLTLLPAFESEGLEGSEGWAVGQGATGVAWARNSYVLATGAAVSDGTYGLTDLQQAKYTRLAVVASAPVQNARGKQIGVLSVSSETAAGPLERPDGQDLHVELTKVVARVLIDIARIADD